MNVKSPSHWTIRAQIVSGMLVVLAILTTFSMLLDPPRHRRERLEFERTRLIGAADMVSLGVSVGLRGTDLSTVARAIDWVKRDTTFVYAGVIMADGQRLAEYNPRKLNVSVSSSALPLRQVQDDGQSLTVAVPIADDQGTIGRLVVRMSLVAAETAIASDRHAQLALLGGGMLLAAIIGSLLAKRIATPLVRLRVLTEQVSQGDYDFNVPESGAVEARALGKALNLMIGRIRDSIHTLGDQARELAASRDAALAAARSKSLFLATMSHEIRTPMNGVLGMLDLLMRTSLSTRQATFARNARDSAEALLIVIDDILDFSKIEAGKLRLESVSFSPADVTEDVATLLAERAHRKGVQVVCDVGAEVPAAVLGDPTRLRQVLLNLGGNAVKFTQHGDVTLRLRASTVEDGDYELTFEVIDTGIGITPDQVTRLFQPFTQADTSTARKFGGTGLGLSIVKHLVAMMRGDISVESSLGSGSTFRFTIRASLGESTRAVDVSSSRGMRVLVVEPHDASRGIVARYVREGGGIAVEAASCEEGFAAMMSAPPNAQFDVALVDWTMACRLQHNPVHVMRANPALEKVAVVALMQLQDDSEPMRAGDAMHQLMKPVHREELGHTLANVRNGTAPADTSQESAEDAAPAARRGGQSILVAEDNVINQEIARQVLLILGYIPTIVNNGREAVEAFNAGTFDAIMMDCQMPEMDGYEATRLIRAQPGRGARIPIIALTANAIEGDREECIVAGMSDYLAKPYTRQQLTDILAHWVGTADELTDAEPAVPNMSQREWRDGDPAIDITHLRHLVGSDTTKTTRLLESFAASGDEIIRDLMTRAVACDWPAAARLAHRLQGVSGGVGAHALWATAGEIERAAREEDGAEVSRLVQILAARFADARRFVGV